MVYKLIIDLLEHQHVLCVALNRCRFTNRKVSETASMSQEEKVGPHSRNRSLGFPPSLFPDKSHPGPHGTDSKGAPASSSGSYQSKLEEHMLTGTALCV